MSGVSHRTEAQQFGANFVTAAWENLHEPHSDADVAVP
jgi:hypothetical protein